MFTRLTFLLVLALLIWQPATAEDSTQRILVVFASESSAYRSSGFQPAYRARKRYALPPVVRRNAHNVASEFNLVEIDGWPLKSLSAYCYVFEVSSGDLTDVIARLTSDPRVEVAQPLHTFVTQTTVATAYDDTYADMQHSLNAIELATAHQVSRGKNVRIAIVDSDVDAQHEDFGRALRRSRFVDLSNRQSDRRHGTAVASVIGARANNSRGMVGIAPDARLEVAEACWHDRASERAICDSFSLAKALDSMMDKPPDVINLSLAGPEDELLRRILDKLIASGSVVVAAAPTRDDAGGQFPASMAGVIAAAQIDASDDGPVGDRVFAPGDGILVAMPS
ncbi:MAG: S8 family serine peptidase, partial [Woeseiaceae bacterium]|nr:S8 family serine peptidase [Woeseiaceae bacterium]